MSGPFPYTTAGAQSVCLLQLLDSSATVHSGRRFAGGGLALPVDFHVIQQCTASFYGPSNNTCPGESMWEVAQ